MNSDGIDPSEARDVIHRRLSRRDFLQVAASSAGALVVALELPGCSKSDRGLSTAATGPFAANAWLTIASDDSITFYCARSEMGQGVYTGLTTLVAEELHVDPHRIAVRFAPVGEAYINEVNGNQSTGGNTSMLDAWVKLRTAGAQAREMLVAAAAQSWGVSTSGCRVERGSVIGPAGQVASYGSLAGAAAKLTPPKSVKLKEAGAYALIGKDGRRLDSSMKVDGSAQFGADVRLPGMLYGALAQTPVLGGKLQGFDASVAKAMPGVREVLLTSSGVVVVADTWWQAKRARDSLTIDWDEGPNTALDDEAIRSGLRAASKRAGVPARQDGDIATAMASATQVVSAEYELPLLAHATMEPQNCTADVRADGCDIYLPTQVQALARATVAKILGLTEDKVQVHTTFAGGGFGRRLEVDVIPAAVEASRAVGKPVQVLWTREDDTTHDMYRPPAHDTVAGAFDSDGRLIAWKMHLTSPSITARMYPSMVSDGRVDPYAIEVADNYPYDVPNVLVDYVRHEIGVDVGYWRSVSTGLNGFVVESFMDELAAVAGQDPVAFRLSLLGKQPRHRAVLERAAAAADYGQPPPGRHHGVALMNAYGTYMAEVAEISILKGKLRVHRIVCALDCGLLVNPSIMVSHVESAILFGLTSALWGEINVRGGRVVQKNFDTYRLLRINESPFIETYFIPGSDEPEGNGEAATGLVAPAVCNAINAATGNRMRSLPLAKHGLA